MSTLLVLTAFYWILGLLVLPLWVTIGGWVAGGQENASKTRGRRSSGRGEIFSVTNPTDDR